MGDVSIYMTWVVPYHAEAYPVICWAREPLVDARAVLLETNTAAQAAALVALLCNRKGGSYVAPGISYKMGRIEEEGFYEFKEQLHALWELSLQLKQEGEEQCRSREILAI